MIQIENLTYKYNNNPALNGITLDINQGEYLCIIGNNGSGKSTLAKLLNGILNPTSGAVYIDNIQTTKEEAIFEIRKKIGIVFQNPDNQIISSVVHEDVAFGPQNLKLSINETNTVVEEALQEVDLYEKKEDLTSNLSGGQKQRLAIAGVLAMKPKCIIFDEATSMLDKEGTVKVLDIIKKLNKENNITIIQITHNMEEVLNSDRVIVMNKGKIVLDDTPLEVFKNVELLKELDLDIPIALQLAHELKKEGINLNTNILSSEDFVEEIGRCIQK